MLRCTSCGNTYPEKFILRCKCGAPLNLIRHYSGKFEDFLRIQFLDIRRYLPLLGGDLQFYPQIVPPLTPVVEKKIHNIIALFKLEYLMPSGSFKDRGTYITMAKLKEESIKEVVLDSSGNAAISLALYGLSERMKVHIFIPKHTSKSKKRILKILKAVIHEVDGDRMETHIKAEEFKGGVYVSHWYNPYFLGGTKSFAYEFFEEAGEVNYAIIPTGSGTMLLGTYKGFEELYKFGEIKIAPRLIAVQAEGYESLLPMGKRKNRLAEGIAIPQPPRKEEIIEAIEKSGGMAISVSEEETMNTWKKLISMGFLVEPTSATAFAAFEKLISKDYFEKGSRILIPLTGSGLKNLEEMMEIIIGGKTI